MGITDDTAIVIFILIFNYLILYRKNKFFGNIVFMVTGLMSIMNSRVHVGFSIILMAMAFMSFLYDVFTSKHTVVTTD